ncbi:ABC transporter substrate-binding protein [Caenimonas soli]|uniref:ABC transporter substrate-binding protein n=1 Tax=Caenimonas soli TaxID=2735555 RepID=UPI001556B24F|nr:ABC transporter substrate-binding protein [Caenimonas soli]NPC58553.1 ABC transporter substrate-binding protein [Caenimonas soli]
MITTTLCVLFVFFSGLAQAEEKPLRKVKIAVGTAVLNVAYPWLMMPQVLGYWRDEGYDVEVLPVGGGLQAVQQMVAGNADFGQMSSPLIIQSAVKNDIPLRAVMVNGTIDWSISVLQDGPIRNVTDLRGKAIGVFSLAVGGIAYMNAYLQSAGVSPKDVKLIPVGMGAPAVEALRTNKVQALVYWGGAQASFENAGLKLRYFRSPDWSQYPDFALTTLQKTIDRDPQMVQAIARGAVKASIFAMANPDCVRRLQWGRWPETKPRGAEEASQIKWDMHTLDASLTTMRDSLVVGDGKTWGKATSAAYSKLQDFVFSVGMIDRKIDPENYIVKIPGFYEKSNDIDVASIRAEAAACRTK